MGTNASNIKEMFNFISRRYDLLNHVLSAGQDIHWRRFVAKRVPQSAKAILDLAVGTADMALAIKKANRRARIIGADFAGEMMKIGIRKTAKMRFEKEISFTGADGLCLPFKDESFDAVTIAFGLRNFKDRLKGLTEMKRVTKKGGKIFVLEMTLPRKGLAHRFFRWYLGKMIPLIAGTLATNKNAYGYLSSSIENFLGPEELRDLFCKAGLTAIKAYPLSFGITYLHEGSVP